MEQVLDRHLMRLIAIETASSELLLAIEKASSYLDDERIEALRTAASYDGDRLYFPGDPVAQNLFDAIRNLRSALALQPGEPSP